METWRFIQGNSNYSVSSSGMVRNNKRGTLLKPYLTKKAVRKSGSEIKPYYRVLCGKKNYVLLSMMYKTFHNIDISKRVTCSLVDESLQNLNAFHIDNIQSESKIDGNYPFFVIPGEEWRPTEFEQIEVSDKGRIRKGDKMVLLRHRIYGRNGVKNIVFFPDTKTKNPILVKSVVASAFLNKHRLDDVWMKDGNEKNCNVSNLMLANHQRYAYRGIKSRTLHRAERKELLYSRAGCESVDVAVELINGNVKPFNEYFTEHYDKILRIVGSVLSKENADPQDVYDFVMDAYERAPQLVNDYKFTGNGSLLSFIIGVARLEHRKTVGRNKERSLYLQNGDGEEMGIVTDYNDVHPNCNWDCFA